LALGPEPGLGRKWKKPALFRTGFFSKFPGGDLLSHPVAQAVPSAVRGLTSGFGMGPGVSPSLWPPERYSVFQETSPSKTDSEREHQIKPSDY
jgi:hypothetical protein